MAFANYTALIRDVIYIGNCIQLFLILIPYGHKWKSKVKIAIYIVISSKISHWCRMKGRFVEILSKKSFFYVSELVFSRNFMILV